MSQGAPFACKFLCTRKTRFYLISCLLDHLRLPKSCAISTGRRAGESHFDDWQVLPRYALVMAVVCVDRRAALPRSGKMHGRSFMVVLISLVAMTTGFDELCIVRSIAILPRPLPARVGCCYALSSIEVLIRRFCRLRAWLVVRLDLSVRLLRRVHLCFRNWLGNAVASNARIALANWGSRTCSRLAISAALLLSHRRRCVSGKESDYVKENGTPWDLAAVSHLPRSWCWWCWPAYAAHAIWMSFGFYGTAGKFEPFLLLPIGAAILVLIAECGRGLKKDNLQSLALSLTPLLAICGLANRGNTWLPIQQDIQLLFGSAWTASLLTILGLYGLFCIRGIRGASFGIPASLLLIGWSNDLPEFAESAGLQAWMFTALASVATLFIAVRKLDQEWWWVALSLSLASTVLMACESYGYRTEGWIAAFAFSVGAFLVIGAYFDSDLATLLRRLACASLLGAAGFSILRFNRTGDLVALMIPPLGASLAVGYGFLVRRSGWFYVASAQVLLFTFAVAWSSRRSHHWKRINLPIASGMVCLGVGLLITTSKTNLYRRLKVLLRLRARRVESNKQSPFKSGL